MDEQSGKYWCALCSKEIILKTSETKVSDTLIGDLPTFSNQPNLELAEQVSNKPNSDLEKKIQEKKERLSATFKSAETGGEQEAVSSKPKELTLKHLLVVGGSLLLAVMLVGAGIFTWFYVKGNQPQEVVVKSEKKKVRVWSAEESSDYSDALSFAKECLQSESQQDLLPRLFPMDDRDAKVDKQWSMLLNDTNLQYKNVYYLSAGFLGYVFQQPFSNGFRRVIIYRSPEDKYYFDWLSYTGTQDLDISELSSLSAGEEVLIRAYLEPSSYFNFGYTEGEWGSFILKNAAVDDKYLKPVQAFFPKSLSYGLNLGTMKLLKVQWTGKVVEIVELVSDSPTVYSFENFGLPNLEN